MARGGQLNVAIVDASALYASVDATDLGHDHCREVLSSPGLRLVIPALVLCEVCHFVGKRLGSVVEARFLATLADLDVQAPIPDDWGRIADLVRQYRDLPLGGTDASIVALAERLKTDLLITLDRRHFATVRPRHVQAFRILPE